MTTYFDMMGWLLYGGGISLLESEALTQVRAHLGDNLVTCEICQKGFLKTPPQGSKTLHTCGPQDKEVSLIQAAMQARLDHVCKEYLGHHHDNVPALKRDIEKGLFSMVDHDFFVHERLLQGTLLSSNLRKW